MLHYACCDWIELSEYSNASTNDSLDLNTKSFIIIANTNRNYQMNKTFGNDLKRDNMVVVIGKIVFVHVDNPISREAVISRFQDTIESCNDLTLDARNSTNLGCRSGKFLQYMDTINTNGEYDKNCTIIFDGNYANYQAITFLLV